MLMRTGRRVAGSQGYIIGAGTFEGEVSPSHRAKDYLVGTRGIDAGRLTVVDGGCRGDLMVWLFVCAPGAPQPTAPSDGAISPCPTKAVRKARAPRRTHRVKKAGDDEEE